MKKRIVMALLAVEISCMALNGCSGKEQTDSKPVETVADAETNVGKQEETGSVVPQEEYDNVVEERDKYKALYESVSQGLNSDDKTTVDEENISPEDKDAGIQDYKENVKVKEYTYVNSINNTVYCMVIKNKSDKVLKFEANVTAYDKDGNLIGAGTMDEYAVETGYPAVMYKQFDNENIDHFEYDLDIQQDSMFKPVVSNIDLKTNQADKKLIVSCKNNGKVDAEYVKVTALFFKEGSLVNIGETYCIDNSFVLNPGKTISKEINAFTDFDDVKVFLSGREK